ncbi:MAG TPA: endo-1,4-beta-xylanase, partial [Sphingomicrobium sp.]
MKLSRRECLMAAGALSASACTVTNNVTFAPGSIPLDVLARRRGRRFGSAVAWGAPGADRGSFANPAYAAILERECGVLVPENELKWQAIRRTQAYDFAQFDHIADYATARGMKLRGHTLFWYPEKWYPEWLVRHDFGARPATAAANLLTDH